MNREEVRAKLMAASFRAIKSVGVIRAANHILIDIRALPPFVASAFNGMRVRLRIPAQLQEGRIIEGELSAVEVLPPNGCVPVIRLYAATPHGRMLLRTPSIHASHRAYKAASHHFRFVPDVKDDTMPISSRRVFQRSGFSTKSNVADVTFLFNGEERTLQNGSFAHEVLP